MCYTVRTCCINDQNKNNARTYVALGGIERLEEVGRRPL